MLIDQWFKDYVLEDFNTLESPDHNHRIDLVVENLIEYGHPMVNNMNETEVYELVETIIKSEVNNVN